MTDPGRLRALLDRLAEELAHLRRLAAYPPAELLADPDRLAAIKYRFVVAIEICIDAGQHIVASENLRAPTSFAGVFAVLAESSFVPASLVPNLQSMARFRNLLVHGYLAVDDRQVIQILQSHLGEFEAFRTEIARSASQ